MKGGNGRKSALTNILIPFSWADADRWTVGNRTMELY